jgi:cysteine desulfurase
MRKTKGKRYEPDLSGLQRHYPIAEEVADAMMPFLREHFGNPSSSHPYGAVTKLAIETARCQVAELIHCQPEELIFTSGGAESNNLAIRGAVLAGRERGKSAAGWKARASV